MYVCRSGSAADTQAISAYVQYYLHQHQMELNDEILVKTAATLATKLVYTNKVLKPFGANLFCAEDSPASICTFLIMCISLQEMLQAGLIVAGYDSREGGQVYAVPLGGTLVKVPFSIGGQNYVLPIHSVAGQLGV